MSNRAMYSTKYLQQSWDNPWTNSSLSQFHPGSILEHQNNTGSPTIILGLSHSPALLWQSIPVCRTNPGGPEIFRTPPPPSQDPCGIVSQYASVTLAVSGLSWDSLTPPPSTPVAEYPGMPELHWQSQDYPGTLSLPSTPVAGYPGMLE